MTYRPVVVRYYFAMYHGPKQILASTMPWRPTIYPNKVFKRYNSSSVLTPDMEKAVNYMWMLLVEQRKLYVRKSMGEKWISWKDREKVILATGNANVSNNVSNNVCTEKKNFIMILLLI